MVSRSSSSLQSAPVDTIDVDTTSENQPGIRGFVNVNAWIKNETSGLMAAGRANR